MKELPFHKWAELSVVSDITGQKLFLIQSDSLTFQPYKVVGKLLNLEKCPVSEVGTTSCA